MDNILYEIQKLPRVITVVMIELSTSVLWPTQKPFVEKPFVLKPLWNRCIEKPLQQMLEDVLDFLLGDDDYDFLEVHHSTFLMSFIASNIKSIVSIKVKQRNDGLTDQVREQKNNMCTFFVESVNFGREKCRMGYRENRENRENRGNWGNWSVERLSSITIWWRHDDVSKYELQDAHFYEFHRIEYQECCHY